ncbi:MAG: hypothetical protein H6738_18045 [Alphaproteobacteria bacterium]|nr:hypothetical protein [Alphaproteobacteria bacterium]
MERRVVVGFLAGAVVGAALGRMWPDRPEVAPAAVVRAPARRVVPHGPTLLRFEPAPIAVPVPAPDPDSAHEAALRALAEHTGDAVLRCDVSGLVPDGPVVGVARAKVVDGVLLAVVDESRGDAQLRRPDDLPSAAPLAVVRWWRAWEEDAGCEALPPEEVLVGGTVVDLAGNPVAGEVGNVVDGGHPTAPDGTFAHRCWRGSECALGARRSGDLRWSTFVVVVPEEDGAELRLVLDEPRPTQDLRTWLQQRIADDDRLAAEPDPLRLAMQDPDLSDEGRAALQAWLDEQDEERATHRALLGSLP